MVAAKLLRLLVQLFHLLQLLHFEGLVQILKVHFDLPAYLRIDSLNLHQILHADPYCLLSLLNYLLELVAEVLGVGG